MFYLLRFLVRNDCCHNSHGSVAVLHITFWNFWQLYYIIYLFIKSNAKHGGGVTSCIKLTVIAISHYHWDVSAKYKADSCAFVMHYYQAVLWRQLLGSIPHGRVIYKKIQSMDHFSWNYIRQIKQLPHKKKLYLSVYKSLRTKVFKWYD